MIGAGAGDASRYSSSSNFNEVVRILAASAPEHRVRKNMKLLSEKKRNK
jgi:hypothetical protein